MAFRHRAAVVALAALVLLASTAFSSTAFTSAEVDRDVTVSVTSDDAALIALIDGHPSSGLVEQDGGGTLSIDFTRGGATGPNEDAVFEFGSAASPASNHAFRIENRGDREKPLTVSFTLTGSDGGDPAPNVEFTFLVDLNADGSIEETVAVSEEDAEATTTDVGPDDVVYVVVTVDTQGLGGSTDLTGDLSITAGP